MRDAAWEELVTRLRGELRTDSATRKAYATDASVYQQRPMAVAYPRDVEDCRTLLAYAERHRVALIPRAAGTSVAGQCTGDGVVVDCSRHMGRVLDIDAERRRARVQSGVILDDLNDLLHEHNLMFAPDTSTSNRCMIGGMIGNNSAGAYSILYGTTRHHVEAVSVVLAGGERVRFAPLDEEGLAAKLAAPGREGAIYRTVYTLVEEHRELIRARFPKSGIVRRSTGYALDWLAECRPWNPDGPEFNLAPLICGSEGTLALVVEAELVLTPRPSCRALICAHFNSLEAAVAGVTVALACEPAAVEMMDRRVLDCSKENLEQSRNRFWIEGDPEVVLVVELFADDVEMLARRLAETRARLAAETAGYSFPVVEGSDAGRVWAVRKAGLGLLMGLRSRRKPVAVIEDSAVAVADLPAFVEEIRRIMERHRLECVYYGHASVGLLHLRPELDLGETEDRTRFSLVAEEVAALVGRLGGALSGEHGDGRVRSPLLAKVLGEEACALLGRVKQAFDPGGVLNPHKIVDPLPIDRDLRPATPEDYGDSAFDWSADGGLALALERCNGSGVCRKGGGRGAMCPSYQASGEELWATRGRANLLRQGFRGADWDEEDYSAIDRTMERCLSCKSCKSECPAGVDMARLKAEYLQRRHDRHGASWATRLMAELPRLLALASRAPRLARWLSQRSGVKRLLGVAEPRVLPPLADQTLDRWWRQRSTVSATDAPAVVLYIDPLTRFSEPEVGRAAVEVLEGAGYRVVPYFARHSARVLIGAGLVRRASAVLAEQVAALAELGVGEETPLLGLEPAELLTFRDEAPDLLRGMSRERLEGMGRPLLWEEFIAREMAKGRWPAERFMGYRGELLLHLHCHQRALTDASISLVAYQCLSGANLVTSGASCCGMGGEFGYRPENYELSMAIGEQGLFSDLAAAPEARVVAAGTSCRQQINAGTGRRAVHPCQLFLEAMESRWR